MAEIVNPRSARKQAARKAARSVADAQAAKFGRSKAEKELQQARAAKAARDLDAHHRDREQDQD